MSVQKVYLVAGLLLWIAAAIAQVAGGDVDTLALVGILTLALGLLQPYIKLPGAVNLATLVVFVAGAVGFIMGGKKGDLAGAACWVLALLSEAAGVVLLSGRASQSNKGAAV